MLNKITLGYAKSIALPTKVINLSLSAHPGSQRAISFFFYQEFTRERERAAARRSVSSRVPDTVDLARIFVFLPFSSFFLSLVVLAVQRERNDGPARSMDCGMILCNEGCGIFMPERAGARDRRPPRRIQARHTSRGRCLSLPLGVYSLCIAGG